MSLFSRIWKLLFPVDLTRVFSEEAEAKRAVQVRVITERRFKMEMDAYVRKVERKGFIFQY